MPPVDRKNPVRAASSDSGYSLMEFMRQFPDDEACLQWLWRTRHAPDGLQADCPKCELPRPFHRVKGRPAWDCDYCGYHLHPTAGTIFQKSSTSLHLWFFAMYLMATTRCGISAKQLEREIGVTYKTAWRMLNLIRNQLMDESADKPLSGKVEMDETGYGGKPRLKDKVRTTNPSEVMLATARKKTTVFGMVERGGRVRAMAVPDRSGPSLRGNARRYVLPASMIFTDEFPVYRGLHRHFAGHQRIKHKAGVYVDGDVHTQTVEGFFGLVKTGISGTYHAVSAKWLQGYLNEYVWRYNRREDPEMFRALLARAAS